MKRKLKITFVAALIVAVGVFIFWESVKPIAVYAACSVANCREPGGARWTIGSGGSLDVLSSGELDIESGGALKIAGSAVTATAAELNAMDGITSTVAELNTLDGFTGDVTDLNYSKLLFDTGVTTTEYDLLDGAVGLVRSTLTTNTVDAANAVWGVSGGIRLEGSGATTAETTITATNPATVDQVITHPDATGITILTGNISVENGADTACATTCTNTCIIGIDGTNFVACSDATADSCLCNTTD